MKKRNEQIEIEKDKNGNVLTSDFEVNYNYRMDGRVVATLNQNLVDCSIEDYKAIRQEVARLLFNGFTNKVSLKFKEKLSVLFEKLKVKTIHLDLEDKVQYELVVSEF